MIRDLEKVIGIGSFETIHYFKDTSKINAIRFNTIPGYTLKETLPEEIQLWKDVRQQVSNYFSQK
tara:strand:+ start:707 stop:901 length:195 start_codon:yes stop_codon:yes gene_type:complete